MSHDIPAKRIHLYGLDLAALVVGIALMALGVYPVCGLILTVVSTVVFMVVTVINARRVD